MKISEDQNRIEHDGIVGEFVEEELNGCDCCCFYNNNNPHCRLEDWGYCMAGGRKDYREGYFRRVEDEMDY